MGDMISVATGFQYSVNIAYDLNKDDKLRGFIPTRPALSLLEDVLLSTLPQSTERSRILIGAYGKGKSHIVLTILSMLLKKDINLFRKMLPILEKEPALKQAVINYYESNNKILPIIITGSSSSITQAFLLALERTLSEQEFNDIMPETNYKAAISVINKWKESYPDTFSKFEKAINQDVGDFIKHLEYYDGNAYELFEKLYPSLTSGSIFNPFLGFDVVELYENAAKGLKKKGYSGIYVVYDEFSKYLEANIQTASVSDTKTLQDFAEKCNRSADLQMHLMLISHKEISNYIDRLPKQKVDGWRGVSERFKHIHLNNDFSQTYEIISSVIEKDKTRWKAFINENKSSFSSLEEIYRNSLILRGENDPLNSALYGCYPLHPVSTFILPRLSEKVAQNERTLFTFLSSSGPSTLSAFLSDNPSDSFKLLTPDLIFDYFEPLFRKEPYGSYIHSTYTLTARILNEIKDNVLGSKIIKALSLIYLLEQFEIIQPTKEEICNIYRFDYSINEIEAEIDNLIANKFVIYLKRSNNYLRLKQSSGVDIRQKINDLMVSQSSKFAIKDTLNNLNIDSYMYPSRYNDSREMLRYFAFRFIEDSEVSANTDWELKGNSINSDGIIYAILPSSEDAIPHIIQSVQASSENTSRCIFIIPKRYHEISQTVKELNAVIQLRDEANEDPVLFDEYEVIYEDLNEVINDFINEFTHPESGKCIYYYKGKPVVIRRRASLTELMSKICDFVFAYSPVINNEAVNRNEITSIALNSRNKVVSALLRNELEQNLGFSGTGQEVSIMRSTLIRTGIWEDGSGMPHLNIHPDEERMNHVLVTIEDFILESRKKDLCFSELYFRLTSPEWKIGLRKGVIPIYLACVLHEYKKQIVIKDRVGQVPTSSEVLSQINTNPSSFSLSYLDWTPQKEKYISAISVIFKDNVIDAEKTISSYDYAANAIRRWYLALPKFTKGSRTMPSGIPIKSNYLELMQLLRRNTSNSEFIFDMVPSTLGFPLEAPEIISELKDFKSLFDNLLGDLKEHLKDITNEIFTDSISDSNKAVPLFTTIKDWCDSLDQHVFEELFEDGTDRCLSLFKSITSNEDQFIEKLAKLTSDIRIEDWDESKLDIFKDRLKKYKETASTFSYSGETAASIGAETYQITYKDDSGNMITKRFNRVERTNKGALLENQIKASLRAMGQSITEQEKRQILMDILGHLC